MTIRDILKMGDGRLLRVANPVEAFDTPGLHALIADMRETMAAVNGAGLAAPQIGVDLQVVIFGSAAVNPRYPDRPVVPRTVLINPVITPLGLSEEEDWKAVCRCPVCAVSCRAGRTSGTPALTNGAKPLIARSMVFMPAWFNTNVTT